MNDRFLMSGREYIYIGLECKVVVIFLLFLVLFVLGIINIKLIVVNIYFWMIILKLRDYIFDLNLLMICCWELGVLEWCKRLFMLIMVV